MSLRDTLEGAQKEARAAVEGRVASPKDEGKAGEESGEGFSRSFRSSAANARPSREAGASVRTVSSTKSTGKPKTKAEKEALKEERRRERDLESFRQRGYEIVLRQNERYRKSERTWWILLGIGFGMTLVTLLVVFLYPEASNNFSTAFGIVSLVSLIAAYALIIGGFIYDLVVRRPIRKQVERKVASYSDKKIAEIIDRERKRVMEEEEARRAKKGKKARK